MPFEIIARPIPPVLDEAKVESLMEALQDPQKEEEASAKYCDSASIEYCA